MNKKILFLLLLILIFPINTFAQNNTEVQLDELLYNLSSLQADLKKDRRKRPVARKIKTITRKIIKAVNSIPSENCMDIIRIAMNDFYELVSDLGLGITCGPPILPPFLPGEDDVSIEPLIEDCILPEPLERLQIGGPFGGSFADVYPIYNEARDLFQIDTDTTEISDVCEGHE